MSPPQALIYDVDGTLAETEEAHRRAFNETFSAWGLCWRWDRGTYKRLLDVTGGKERIAHFIDNWRPPKGDQVRPRIADLHRQKTARYVEIIARGDIGLRPGVARLIEAACNAGCRLAIATTTSRANVDALLSVTFPAGHPFEVIAAGDEVTAKKPAGDVYQLALDRLGVPGDRCLAIEDSQNGLAAATAAGLSCIITPSLYTADQDFTGAVLVSQPDCLDIGRVLALTPA